MKKRRTLITWLSALLTPVLILTMLSGVTSTQVYAASSSEIKNQINKLEDKKDKLEDEKDAISDKIDETQSEIKKIAAKKSAIDQEVGILSQQMLILNEQITAYGLLIADKQDELDAAQKRLEELNEKNKERIRAMEEDGNISYWSVLFNANSFADLLDRLNMIEEIAAADRRRLKEMREAAEVVAQAQKELETEKAALEETKAEMDGKFAELEEKRAQADGLLAELHAKNEEFEDMMDEVESQEEDLLAQIAKKEKEYNEQKKKEEAAAKPSYGTGNRPPTIQEMNGITWRIPCEYSRVSSPYGWRIHPVYNTRKFHSGIDLAAAKGTPIYASRSGEVTTAQYHYSAGNYVTINHGDGFSTSYLHMTHYIVSVGDQVKAGQLIGYVGSTGVSTGPHLHFTIYYNGETVNPASYIKF